jgi:hypothetical protein
MSSMEFENVPFITMIAAGLALVALLDWRSRPRRSERRFWTTRYPKQASAPQLGGSRHDCWVWVGLSFSLSNLVLGEFDRYGSLPHRESENIHRNRRPNERLPSGYAAVAWALRFRSTR